MKNYWLNNKFMNRFPQDDEYSLQQGGGPGECANLDIFYPCRFVQNEELQILSGLTSKVVVSYEYNKEE